MKNSTPRAFAAGLILVIAGLCFLNAWFSGPIHAGSLVLPALLAFFSLALLFFAIRMRGEKSRWAHLGVTLAAFLAMPCALALVAFGCVYIVFTQPSSHPSDNQMFDNYVQHEAEFNHLVQILIDEKEFGFVSASGNGQCQSTPEQEWIEGTDDPKCAEYVRLLDQLGMAEGDCRYSQACVFRISAEGAFLRGTYKGYIYTKQSPVPPGTIVDDTQAKGVSMPRYKPVRDNWYIYYSSYPVGLAGYD
ncbi:MAG: hypothetical protein JXA89_04840 [Anaerolineae bacterium]|nr:hypothetical protein [Anaerolineae bacterium]